MKPIFLVSSLIALSCANANAAVHANCLPYGDCDMLVACELVYDVRNAIAGGAVDYNTTVAGAILSKDACRNYANDFVRNIDTVVYDNPTVNLTINWDTVKGLVNANPNNAEINVKTGALATIEKLDGFEDLSNPFYAVLVARKGSLDSYLGPNGNNLISTLEMRANHAKFYPENSYSWLGLSGGKCTHEAHDAPDGDIINMAAHITQREKDSFTSGNDYYVFDGSEMYWGVASITADVVLTVATVGMSAWAQGAVKSTQLAKAATTLPKSARVGQAVMEATRVGALKKQINAGKAAGKTLDIIAKEQKISVKTAQMIDGLTVIGTAGAKLNTAAATSKVTGLFHIPKLSRFFSGGINAANLTLNNGTNVLKLSQGAMGFRQRLMNKSLGLIATAIPSAALAAPSIGFMTIVNDMWNVSQANSDIFSDGTDFNSFGLLSADDLHDKYLKPDGTSLIEGYSGGDLRNIASHGMWLKWDGSVTDQSADDNALYNASDFAQRFSKDTETVNIREKDGGRSARRLCDIDIFVVRPIIKKSGGKSEVYYLIMNETPLRISNPG